MKIDRQMTILNLLIKYGSVTTPFLAERLEVSKRTVNRDIEDLCYAGIPIITKQGNGGGIALMDGYTLDKTLLKKGDWENIVAALKGLGSVSSSGNIDNLLTRLPVDKEQLKNGSGNIIIDLASYYKLSLSTKIDDLDKAINNFSIVNFLYYSHRGKSRRQVEPYKIIFQWSDWYLLGLCLEKEDFRMFKLNRLWDLVVEDLKYRPRVIDESQLQFNEHLTDEHKFKAVFSKAVEYLLVEAYGPDSYEEKEGHLLFNGSYTKLDYITSWLLSFGNNVKVLEPEELIQHMIKNAPKFCEYLE